MIDPDKIRISVALVLLLVAGIDFGIAFLMRGEREASSGIDPR